MNSNVVQLFAEDTSMPAPSSLDQLISMITDWSEQQGVDIRSSKYTIEVGMIATMLEIMAR